MAWSFLDTVNKYFSQSLISQASSYLGESEATVRRGVDLVIPVTLAGIVKKAEDGDLSALLNWGKEAMNSGILENLSGTFSSSEGGVPAISPGLISGLFGDKWGGIANSVSSFIGMKGASTSSLFGSVVPLALAVLARHVKENNHAPGAISSLLKQQKSAILSALPSGFDLSKFINLNAETLQTTAKKNNWLLPLIAVLAAVVLLLWFWRGCNKTENTVPATDTVVQKTVDTVVLDREQAKVKLPNGVELDCYKGSIEELLVAFLNDPNAMPGQDNWFDFNDLNFVFGTAEIVPESRKELDNLIEILKAYPKVKIKIGGYTDKVGDEAANVKLSSDRAAAVKAELDAAGVGSQVVGSEGYGSQFAKYPASAPEVDRLKDRRVSVSVREK
jgi:outer membrane protein OmpA-like peptidoglycan-associated protein